MYCTAGLERGRPNISGCTVQSECIGINERKLAFLSLVNGISRERGFGSLGIYHYCICVHDCPKSFFAGYTE